MLIKGGVHRENLGHLDTVALDKIGTPTTGRFTVTQIIAFEDTPEDELLRIAAAVEEQSCHPLGAAIVEMSKKRNITFPSATEIENLAGKGIQAKIEGVEVLIGAMRAFAGDPAAERGQPLAATNAKLESGGQTTVIICRAGKFIGVMLLIASGFGGIPLSVGVVLHEGCTIVVVLNALRLLAWREPDNTSR